MSHSLYRLRVDSVKVDFDINEYIGLLGKLKYLRLSYIKKDSKTSLGANGVGMKTAELRSMSMLLESLKELVSAGETGNA